MPSEKQNVQDAVNVPFNMTVRPECFDKKNAVGDGGDGHAKY